MAASRVEAKCGARKVGLYTFAAKTRTAFLAATLEQFTTGFRCFWKFCPKRAPIIFVLFPTKLRWCGNHLSFPERYPDACLVKGSCWRGCFSLNIHSILPHSRCGRLLVKQWQQTTQSRKGIGSMYN